MKLIKQERQKIQERDMYSKFFIFLKNNLILKILKRNILDKKINQQSIDIQLFDWKKDHSIHLLYILDHQEYKLIVDNKTVTINETDKKYITVWKLDWKFQECLEKIVNLYWHLKRQKLTLYINI